MGFEHVLEVLLEELLEITRPIRDVTPPATLPEVMEGPPGSPYKLDTRNIPITIAAERGDAKGR